MKSKNESSNGFKILIVGFVLVCLVIGYYYYLSNKKAESSEETPVEITAVQEVLLYDFERSYPPSPKEVVKRFGDITMCFYNESYTEEEFVALAMKIQELYDDALIANKTENQYVEDLRWDVNQMKEQELQVSSYATSASTDVEFFDKDGRECARLYCSFTIRKGTAIDSINEIFVLRKDEDGHWKILGWKPVEDEKQTGI